MTNIVIEGCDRVGKSTLIKEFLMHGKYEVRHCQAPPKGLTQKQQIAHQRAEYLDGVYDLNGRNDIIYDRFMLGECIYGPIYRDYYPKYMRRLEKKVGDNTIFVVLTASPKLLEERYDGIFIKKEDIPEIVRRFEEEYRKCKVPRKILIRVDGRTPSRIHQLITDYDEASQ